MDNLSPSNSYLTFKLDQELFAIAVERVIEIIEVSQITKIPQTPEYVRGITNLRGNVLPVVETRIKFGMEAIADSIDTCIIVISVMIEGETVNLGILADSVMEVSQFEQTDVKAKPNIGRKYNNNYITGIVRSDEHFVLMLDVNKVFDTEEIIQMTDMTDAEFDLENENELVKEM